MADAVNLQHQVKQNNEELQDFLKDLYKWEDEVQARDKLLVNSNSPGESVRLMSLFTWCFKYTLMLTCHCKIVKYWVRLYNRVMFMRINRRSFTTVQLLFSRILSETKHGGKNPNQY